MSTQHTPMEIKAARALCDRAADACGIDRNDNWNVYAEDFKADAKAMLDACGAPDLLEACKVAFHQTCSVGRPKDWEQLRAAIAKATDVAWAAASQAFDAAKEAEVQAQTKELLRICKETT
jgi:hypothetical protein